MGGGDVCDQSCGLQSKSVRILSSVPDGDEDDEDGGDDVGGRHDGEGNGNRARNGVDSESDNVTGQFEDHFLCRSPFSSHQLRCPIDYRCL